MAMTDHIAASHRDRLGCSELAAAIGISPYKTPYRLWEEKTGRVEPEDLSDNLRVTLGNRLEDAVAKLWSDLTGINLRRRNRPIHHDDWLVAHLDREIVGKREVWEGKTALGLFLSEEWGPDGTDHVPMHYLVQCLGYLGVTGAERCHLAALIAGPELRHYVIERDENTIQRVLERGREFWDNYVRTDTPPPITKISDALRRWPLSSENSLIADQDAISEIAEWRELNRQIKAAEDRIDQIKLSMSRRLEDMDTLVDTSGNKLLTWKTQTTTRLDSKLLKEEEFSIWEAYSTQSTSRPYRLVNGRKK